MRRSLSTVVVCALVVALSACGSGSGTTSSAPPPSPTRTAAGADCPLSRTGGAPAFFGQNPSGYLAGYVYGTGSVGIVFAHEAEGSACIWMPMAAMLAKRGYTTLAFDFAGYGASTMSGNAFPAHVNAAADFLATRGVTSVVLVGASMGGAAVLAAAPDTKVPVAGVIALSSPIAYGGADAIVAAPRITVPLLIECGSQDTNFVDAVKAIYAAAKATKHKQLLFSPTVSHGHQLVEPPSSSPDAVDAFNTFLATYAPPVA